MDKLKKILLKNIYLKYLFKIFNIIDYYYYDFNCDRFLE